MATTVQTKKAKKEKKVPKTTPVPQKSPIQPPLKRYGKIALWFTVGSLIGFFLFTSFAYIFFKEIYANKIYPGVFIGDLDVSGKTQQEVIDLYNEKNDRIQKTLITFTGPEQTIATVSAKDLTIGYNSALLAQQAYSIGRTANLSTNISMLIQSYTQGVELTPSYTFNDDHLRKDLLPVATKIDRDAVEALFTFENGKVTAFQPSVVGRQVDYAAVKKILFKNLLEQSPSSQHLTLPLPITSKKPEITTDKVNNLGIKELLGTGTSLFAGSIENRIYNLTLATNKLNGILIKPGEVFSFVNTVGDITAATGYKPAYVIKNGRTVLDDGGGVCQVSTTFFRAALNAGLPIVERNAHAYRVHYYEEDSGPGIDAAIFYPSVDLKVKNDTGHYILIQSYVDPVSQQITFNLYGTKDGREVTLTKPVIYSQTPPPEPLYQDDPTLPKGTVKQVDWAAWGANVAFSRTVMKDGKVYLSDTFRSNYQPWQAVYLRGTQ